ncbi:ATP-binding protein [Neobacillus sp. DY30]|uniref:sensor histidine kinase n=1 Tax=Neobacillus sp. DY30 TaxID=3047871 RepID=UPI0024BFD565|nr:ATP-binding protein [Neobacillus sp. DY30]WHY00384.1 ATP-binding protein [Neobacillus sp. DY30]
MIIGLLICAIAIIPIVLAVGIRNLYKGSELSFWLLIYMGIVCVWQLDVSILYFKDVLSENTILFIFRLLRISTIFSIPIVFYITYIIINKHTTTFKDNFFNLLLRVIFSRKTLIVLLIWSTVVYITNWTSFGIKKLVVRQASYSSIEFYYPEYGNLSWIFVLHMSSFFIFLFFIYIVSRNILNQYMKNFLKTFSICSLLLFFTGFMNFLPSSGVIVSSIGVIIFSVAIMLSFIKLNTFIIMDYNNLLERQKKLDYTGNLAASLIHEIKNSTQVIKGFVALLNQNFSSNDYAINSLAMVQNATDQLEDLTNNYQDYMKYSKMELKMEDMNAIILSSISLSNEIVKKKGVEVKFDKKYRALRAFVNKTYLQQVFINLIINSTEAFPDDLKSRTIKLEANLVAGNIIINMYDNGKGIPPQNWESIFDPFISSKTGGMGLGLPFVKKIILEHKGEIQIIDSTPSGTQFQIVIPQFELNNFN